MSVEKIGVIIPMSRELLEEYANREPLTTSIRLAPVRRARRLAEETYWPNNPELENPAVVRGSE